MGRMDSHVHSQIELSKIFLNSFIGFHYYTELHLKNFKKERKKKKDIYTHAKHERDQRTHARCRRRKFLTHLNIISIIYEYQKGIGPVIIYRQGGGFGTKQGEI